MKVIRSVVFAGDSAEIQYMDESDVRLEGQAFITHQLTILRGGDHDDEIDAAEQAVEALLVDVLGDFARSLPYEPPVFEDEDDDDDD